MFLHPRTVASFGLALLLAHFAVAPASAGGKKDVWTDINDKTLPVDFKFQGEYVGAVEGGERLGAQVIALGNGALQAVILPGGLPGAGWDGKNKILLSGQVEGDRLGLKAATGKRNYMAQNPDQFSATQKFPPEGQKNYEGTIANGTLTGKTDDGKTFTLKKEIRKSQSLGMKAPAGAITLFDGTNTDEWQGGARLDKEQGIMNTDGHNLLTKRKFDDYTVHLEFFLPYRPDARSQGRGNSGFYQVDLYEVQILDSFGLAGLNNECSGIYSQVAPKVNMCLPPLQWQTYDIDFTNAKRDASGKVTEKARITARLNGVVVHDNLAIATTPGGRPQSQEGTPGPFQLQGHGNPLQFRNIWVVEKK